MERWETCTLEKPLLRITEKGDNEMMNGTPQAEMIHEDHAGWECSCSIILSEGEDKGERQINEYCLLRGERKIFYWCFVECNEQKLRKSESEKKKIVQLRLRLRLSTTFLLLILKSLLVHADDTACFERQKSKSNLCIFQKSSLSVFNAARCKRASGEIEIERVTTWRWFWNWKIKRLLRTASKHEKKRAHSEKWNAFPGLQSRVLLSQDWNVRVQMLRLEPFNAITLS